MTHRRRKTHKEEQLLQTDLIAMQSLRMPVVRYPRRHPVVATVTVVLAILAVACTLDPNAKKQRYFDSGNRYLDQGKYAEAIIEYRNAIEVDATFGQARKRLAQSYARAGNVRAAFDEFVRAADLLPTDVEAQLDAGNFLLVGKQHQEALGRAEVALKTQPENIDALVLRGNALAGLSSFEKALEAIEQAIRLDPKRGATYVDLGQVESAHGRRAEAEAAFLRAVEISPKETSPRLALANFYWSLGRTSDAGQAFDEALKLEPGNLLANRFMASFKYSTGRGPEAELYLRRIADTSASPEAWLALADYYLLMARPQDAIATIEGMKSGRDLPAVKLRLARAQAAAGNQADAHLLVDQILGANDKDAEAQLLKGQLLQLDGKNEEAFATIQKATTLAPDYAEAQFALGRMYASRGDRLAAETAFREVLRINPRATAAQVQLATVQAQTRPAESVRTAEDATRSNPGSVAARLALVRSLIATRDLARAEQEISKLRVEYPNVAAVHRQDVSVALLKKDMARARKSLERAEELEPLSLETLGVAIAYELTQGNPAGARSRLEARLKQGSSPDLLIMAANTYLALKDLAAAEKVLRAAIEADPSRYDAYGSLGAIYVNQGRIDEALREYEALSKKQAKPVGALTLSGILLQRQGKVDAAMKRYEDVLALDSRAGVASNNLAWILAERGQDMDRALQLAQTAVSVAPESPEILDTLGWVYYKRNQPKQAIPYFRQCIEKSPAVAEYHYHLGLALLKSGDQPNGRASLQRALALKPNAGVTAEINKALEGIAN